MPGLSTHLKKGIKASLLQRLYQSVGQFHAPSLLCLCTKKLDSQCDNGYTHVTVWEICSLQSIHLVWEWWGANTATWGPFGDSVVLLGVNLKQRSGGSLVWTKPTILQSKGTQMETTNSIFLFLMPPFYVSVQPNQCWDC